MRIRFSGEGCVGGGPAIFIDRDGVINRRRTEYVLEWSQFIFMPGIREALRDLSSLGLPMIVISNQSAVGRGLLQPAILKDITVRMRDVLRTDGTLLTAAYFCIHRPDEHCSCRKPRPELLYHAVQDFSIDLSRSVFIGDSDADAKAARFAGCQSVLFGPGLTECSDSLSWMRGLPVARASKDLFQVTVDSLLAAEQLASTKRAGSKLQDSSRWKQL